jgi:hypothetical protein
VVFTWPFDRHSKELPWRESIVGVVIIAALGVAVRPGGGLVA